MLSDGEKRDTLPVSIPSVPFGPKGVPVDQADAEYYREAAKYIRFHALHGCSFAGSNLTEAVAELCEAAATALEASLTVPDGDARERLAKIIDPYIDTAIGDYGSGSYDDTLPDAILAAFPVLSRDIAGEIEAEANSELPTEDEDREGWAYLRGLRRAEEIVRNGR